MMDLSMLYEAMHDFGRNKALALREDAPNLTDTEIIEQERFIPEWKAGVQVLNALVRRTKIDQVYRVLQAHDSTATPDWTPESQPALFSVCHTTNPDKAKPWAEPQGTSGMYYLNECYKADGIVYRQIFDGANVYDAATLPERWEIVE